MFGEGFIPGSRGSFFLDFLASALLALVIVQSFSVILVKHFKQYSTHKYLQIVLSAIVLVLIILFEVEVRFVGWKQRAVDSPYYDSWLIPVLIVHICFAVGFLLSWSLTMRAALRKFSTPPKPGIQSKAHRRQARVSIASMLGTVLTGWWFYYLAFIAI